MASIFCYSRRKPRHKSRRKSDEPNLWVIDKQLEMDEGAIVVDPDMLSPVRVEPSPDGKYESFLKFSDAAVMISVSDRLVRIAVPSESWKVEVGEKQMFPFGVQILGNHIEVWESYQKQMTFMELTWPVLAGGETEEPPETSTK